MKRCLMVWMCVGDGGWSSRGEQWSSFLCQLLGLNEALSMDVCWGRRMVMCRGEQWSSFLGQLLGLNEALDL